MQKVSIFHNIQQRLDVKESYAKLNCDHIALKKCSFYRVLKLNEDKEEKIEGVVGFLFNVPLK
jgi:hypothetical protein